MVNDGLAIDFFYKKNKNDFPATIAITFFSPLHIIASTKIELLFYQGKNQQLTINRDTH